MVSRMPFLHGDKQPAPRSTNLALCLQREGDSNPVVQDLGWRGVYCQGCAVRRGAPKLNVVRGGYGAWWFIEALCVHERNSSRPISMTVKQRSDNAPVDHPGEGLVVIGGNKFHGQSMLCTE